MIQVSKKDNKEPFENLLRRFKRKVQQSGNVTAVKQNERFSKPISKTERRKQAIITEQRRQKKLERMRSGGRLRGF